MGERTELRLKEHNWKCMGNGTGSGAVVVEHVANLLGTREDFSTNDRKRGLCIAH